MKKNLFAIFLFLPASALANVRINEVAWMGDAISSAHEWVELYNDTDTPQDLSGWKLVATETDNDEKEKFSIALSGTVAGKGYFLVESKHSANDASAYLASDFTSVSFSLINGGETLRLRNTDNSVINEVKSPFKTKWEKGDNTTKETMQWSASGWITAPATPREKNAEVDTEAPDTDTDTDSDTPTTTTSPSSTLDTSAHVSPLPLSSFSQKQELFLSAGRNRIVAAGSPVSFEAFAIDAKGVKNSGITAKWSFGDGGELGGTSVRHTYEYPGEYIVILRANAGGNEAVSRAEIKVFAPKIAISVEPDGAVSLFNNSEYEINVGGWKISVCAAAFTLAEDTILKAGKKITFPKNIIAAELSTDEEVKLLSPAGNVVAVFSKIKLAPPEIAIAVPPVVSPVEKITEKENIPEISPAPISQKTQRQMAVSMFALTEKEKPKAETSEESAPAEKIIIKKQESWLEKLWSFFF